MLEFSQDRTSRFAVVVAGAAVYFAFTIGLVNAEYVFIRGDFYLTLVGIWLGGLLPAQ